ncbi:SPOR domain-containing protein [Methylicorpusculum sp.]|uniref:SPOR domain-containing protein n=1 Tax=Methylicorpusculum sp. TaxID=2713644 RepID=UPI00272FB857|nr:SPOR domain-containing protein [Methylicorpusculum sp.]MDP2178789.1 SPOR domain-containing protein [Methylicorpusculum sp.]MDP3530366.1 SPOR domain-containing protein [Methylicorpusculum sp.]MDZ4152298.1 SPOR domain-containing protein [Methylicorpusculum sp.]
MADSKEVKTNASSTPKRTAGKPPSFAEDLDSMLDDAASSFDEVGELMDDDDAIDKLLMENSLSSKEDSDEQETDEDLDALFDDDELALDEKNDIRSDKAVTELDDDQFDGLVSDVLDDSFEEASVMAEIDEFDDALSDNLLELPEAKVADEPIETDESPMNALDEDFTLASFDIGDDDEEPEADAYDDETQGVMASAESELDDFDIEIDEFADDEFADDEVASPKETVPAALSDDSVDEFQETVDSKQDESVFNAAVSAQISQLFSELEAIKHKQAALAEPAGTDNSEEFEQLKKAQKTLKAQLDEKIVKLPTISYSALGVGVLGLILGALSTYMVVSSQSELSSVSESVSTLEDDMGALIVKTGQKEMDELKATVEQLSQQVASLTSATNPVPVLPSTQLAAEAQKSAESVPVVVAGKASEPTGKTPDDSKEKVSVTETAAPESTAQIKENDALKTNESAPLPAEKLPEAIKPQEKPVDQQSPKKTVRPAVKKPAPKPVVRKAKASSSRGWAVNLVAFRQDWYAERKAAEFARQGIPVRVVPVEKQGEMWYRLAVPGFVEKSEAQAYAVRLKKALNLDSVWVGQE